MKDKIIVITGATRGLGLRLKEDLSKDNVVITLSRSEVENGKTAFRADVSDFDDVKRVFDEIGKIYGKIDVLINNAGYGLSGATEIMRKEEIERITNVNFLILAAVLTPPDVVSQVLLALPTWILFELSLIFFQMTHKKTEEETEESASDPDVRRNPHE